MLNLHIITVNFKFLLQLKLMSLICLMDHILFQTFKITLSTLFKKKHETIMDNPPVQIYTNKAKNRMVSKIKIGNKIELSSPEIMKLLRSTKKDVDQDKDGEDEPKLESTEVILVHYNLVNNIYQQASKVLFTFVPNTQFGQLINMTPNSLTILNTKKYRVFIH